MKKDTPLSLAQKQALRHKPQKKEFLIFYLVIFPIWLCVLLPLTIFYKIVEKLMIMAKIKKEKIQKSPQEIDSSLLEPTKTAKEDREFDLVVFGATGFTGGFMCEYLAQNYKLITGKISGTRSEKQVFFPISLISSFDGQLPEDPQKNWPN